MTIDGEWSWGARPNPERLSANDGTFVEVYPTASTTRNIELDDRNIVQLWHKREDGSVFFIGQSVVSRDHPAGTSLDIVVKDINDSSIQYAVELEIAKHEKRTTVTLRAGTRN